MQKLTRLGGHGIFQGETIYFHMPSLYIRFISLMADEYNKTKAIVEFASCEKFARREALLARFDVTIAGELNLDLILYGLPEALPPERELLATEMMLTLGSSSAIVAHNLASLGCKVGFSACAGSDDFGEIALERLRAAGVEVSTVRRLGGKSKTGLTVILPREKWRNILTYLGAISALKPEHLDIEYLASSRHFHLSSYFLHRGLLSHIPELLRKLKAAGLTVSLDTNDDPDGMWQSGLRNVLPLVDVLLPNEREAMKIAGRDNLEAALDQLTKLIPLIVVKMGAQGAMACRGQERLHCPALKLDEVVDPVGAGDSFDAGFLSEFVRGADLVACLQKGNLAGALSTTRPGGTEAFRDVAYRESFIREHGQALQTCASPTPDPPASLGPEVSTRREP